MSEFTVTNIIDGDTFEVSPAWQWRGESGTRIRPTGYDAPELHANEWQAARDKLSRLIMWQKVSLGAAYRVDRGRLVCDVYFRGRGLAEYFPGY